MKTGAAERRTLKWSEGRSDYRELGELDALAAGPKILRHAVSTVVYWFYSTLGRLGPSRLRLKPSEDIGAANKAVTSTRYNVTCKCIGRQYLVVSRDDHFQVIYQLSAGPAPRYFSKTYRLYPITNHSWSNVHEYSPAVACMSIESNIEF